MVRIIAVMPSDQDIAELISLEQENVTFTRFDIPCWSCYQPMESGFSLVSEIYRLQGLINETKTDGLIFTDDMQSLLAAHCIEQSGLPGPSSRSAFLANHKYYSRSVEEHPIRYLGMKREQQLARSDLFFPSQIKPVSLSFSMMQKRLCSLNEFDDAIRDMDASIDQWQRPFTELFSRIVSVDEFPLISSSALILEEYIDADHQYAVEGWTNATGEHHLWAVSDNNYVMVDGVRSLDSNTVPSRATPDLQKELFEIAKRTVDRHGISHSFWNIEIWSLRNGDLRVTEVNNRVCASMSPLYKRVIGDSQYPTLVCLSTGRSPTQPVIRHSASSYCGGMYAISTSKHGRVCDLLEINTLRDLRERTGVERSALLYAPDVSVNWTQSGGRCCIARVWITAPDFEELERRAHELRSYLLK